MGWTLLPIEWLLTHPLWHFDAVYGWGRPHCIRPQPLQSDRNRAFAPHTRLSRPHHQSVLESLVTCIPHRTLRALPTAGPQHSA